MAKKLKKAFALLLALSMVMSLLSITAFAEGGAADEAKIVDDIAKNGALKVVGLPDEDASNVWYWYQSVDGKDFTKVPRSGMATSIDIVDEAVENPDQRLYYRVQGIAGGQEFATDSLRVPYFGNLQNRGFERPAVTANGPGQSGGPFTDSGLFNQFKNGTEGLIWRTTATDQRVELVKPSNNNHVHQYNNFHDPLASVSGNLQFAELNAQEYGALYQDVITEPGSTLHWSFLHSGRGTDNHMQLVIGAADSYRADWNPANTVVPENKGAQGVFTGKAQTWQYHEGTYEVPAGQYVTRFYFSSLDGYDGGKEGNLLDEVTFSTERPKPPATLEKYVINYYVDDVFSNSESGSAAAGDLVVPSKLNYYEEFDASAQNPKLDTLIVQADAENEWNFYFTSKTIIDPEKPEAEKPTVAKKATALNGNDETTVTLTIGSTEAREKAAVMFLLDKSTSQGMRDEAAKMLEELKTKNNTDILYNVVIFSGTASATGWKDIADDAAYSDTLKNFVNKSTTSGTNMDAGIQKAEEELKKLPEGYEETYLITLSDGITYVWRENDKTMCLPVATEELTTAHDGADTWDIMYSKDSVSLASIYGDMNGFLEKIPAKIAASKQYTTEYKGYGFAYSNPLVSSTYNKDKKAEVAAKYACGTEISVYRSAAGYAELAKNFSKTFAFAVPELTGAGEDNTKNWENYPWGRELMLYCQSLSTNCEWDASVSNTDAAKIFAGIKNDILYTMESGKVTDVIGDSFDLKAVDSFSLKVGGEPAAVTKIEGSTVTFADGKYVVTYQPAGESRAEQFIWEINTPVEAGKAVQLSYVLRLDAQKKATIPGTYGQDDLDGSKHEPQKGNLTNESAVLDYTSTDGTKDQVDFPKPTVKYTVEDPKPTPTASLSVEKTAPAAVKQDQQLTYTIQVTNTGDAAAKNVVITDTLPAGLTFVSASDNGTANGQTVTWEIGDLAAGAAKRVTVTAAISDSVAAGSVVKNTAVADADNTDPKQDSAETTIEAKDPTPTHSANLTVDKQAPTTIRRDKQLTYTIKVANTGDAAAKNVVITDTLPEGVKLVSVSDNGKADGRIITWNMDELKAGDEKTVTVVVTITDAIANNQVIVNTAQVTADDLDPKEDTVETEVKREPSDDDDDNDDKKKDDDDDSPVVIPEDPTPLDPGTPGASTEISEPTVPRADVPKTGDASALWLALAGISALGLAAVSVFSRKKENG